MDLGKDYQLVLKPDTFLVDGELITCTGLLSNQKRKTSRWWRDFEGTPPNPVINLIIAKSESPDNMWMMQQEEHTSHNVFWTKMFNLNPPTL